MFDLLYQQSPHFVSDHDLSHGSREFLRPLVDRLADGASFSKADVDAILALPHTIRHMPAGTVVVREGDEPTQSCLISEGYCARFKVVGKGSRHIVSFQVPGDLSDLQSLFLRRMDHDIMSITSCVLAFIPHRGLRSLIDDHPKVGMRLWHEGLVEGSIMREWLCNVGGRSAEARLAHLICELYVRAKALGPNKVIFPYTQVHIAEAQGLSAVHVNRILRSLHRRGLVTIKNKVLTVAKWDELRDIADFDEGYLHQRAA